MRVTSLKGDRPYKLDPTEYLIDWERKVSKPQKLVKEFLRPYWQTSVVGEEVRVPGSKCRLDLVNFTRRVVVEVSPDSSHSFNKFFHKNRFKFGGAVQRDLDKVSWCDRNGFTYVELGEDDIANLSVALFKELGVEL